VTMAPEAMPPATRGNATRRREYPYAPRRVYPRVLLARRFRPTHIIAQQRGPWFA
jgi:hypothetical protein